MRSIINLRYIIYLYIKKLEIKKLANLTVLYNNHLVQFIIF